MHLLRRAGHERQFLVMSQMDQGLGSAANLQFGLGANKVPGEPTRPRARLRLIREF